MQARDHPVMTESNIASQNVVKLPMPMEFCPSTSAKV